MIFLGYEFADDDYDLDEDSKTATPKQSTEVLNGEIKKLKEEMAPDAKKESSGSVPIQDAIAPLASIAEHTDEADKSVTLAKNGRSHEIN